MAIIFVRASLVYTILLIVVRLMGKRQIGEMQPFEFVLTLLIADLACIPMSDTSIPLTYGLSAILAIFVIHQFMTIIERLGDFFKFLISGKPSIVINPNGIDFKQLKKNNLDVSDLIESMRGLGYFSLDDVEYAIYESNGTLSAVKNNNQQSSTLPLLLINEGKLVRKNLKTAQLEEREIFNLLKENKIKNLKKVGVLTVDKNGKFYMQEYKSKYLIGKLSLNKGVSW